MFLSRLRSFVITGMAFVVCVTQPAIAAKPTCTSDAMIVFDASGSMAASDFPDGAPSRIDRVRQAISRFVPTVSKVRNLGLIIYGPGPHFDTCRNVSLRFRPIPNAGSRIISEVERAKPEGRTSLTAAVRLAARSFRTSDSVGTIVLVTDGEETCGGNPCKLASELKASYPNVTVHVIGYKLQSFDGYSASSGAECLAEQTGGYTATVETIDALVRALTKSLGCPEVAWHKPAKPLLRQH